MYYNGPGELGGDLKMVSRKSGNMQTNVETDVAVRIANALEAMVEKLGNLENKIEELTYELQAHGNVLADAVLAVPVDDLESGCGTGCGSGECVAEFVEIEK
jgi:hypothetical protein